jgi:hypothetical protein
MNSAPVRFRQDVSDEEILAVVRRWSDTMAAGNYRAALTMVHAPGWTAELLQRTLAGYGDPDAPEQLHQVTLLEFARYRPGDEPFNNPWPRHKVDRFVLPDGKENISVWFDLPLDGYWSDLTATFDLDLKGETLVLALNMIHVM